MTGGIKRGDRLASIMTHLCPTAMDYPTDSDGLLACPFKPKKTKNARFSNQIEHKTAPAWTFHDPFLPVSLSPFSLLTPRAAFG
jgi:hypothetical protein